MVLFGEEKITYPLENSLGGLVVCGVDEAGRGALAGPVVVSAVILPPNYRNSEIVDSKILSPKRRKELSELIKEIALDFSIVEVPVDFIDKFNILNATKKGMADAILNLKESFDLCLIDGNQLPDLCGFNLKSIVRGDSLSLNIAAASILAKVYRDERMESLSRLYPEFGFSKNKGYGTKYHLLKISNCGISPIHRKSFSPIKNIINSRSLYE